MIPLTIKLRADGADFQRGVTAAIGGLQTQIAGLVSVGALAQYTRKIMEFAEAVKNGAIETGVSIEKYQELLYAFRNAGAGAENFSTAMRTLARERDAALEGNAKTVQGFAELGFTLAQLRAMSPDELFTALGRAISAIPDPMQRSAEAVNYFGRSGAKLIQVLQEIETLRAKARADGFIISERDILLVEQMGDELDNILEKIKIIGLRGAVRLFGSQTAMTPGEAAVTSAMTGELGVTGGAIAGSLAKLDEVMKRFIPNISVRGVSLRETGWLPSFLRGMGVTALRDSADALAVVQGNLAAARAKKTREAELAALGEQTWSAEPAWMKTTAAGEAALSRARMERIGLTEMQRIGAFAPGAAAADTLRIAQRQQVIAQRQLETQQQALAVMRKLFGV